ncbi:MAG: hypothetical protein MUC87_12205 [Bacteroidia bacterium]|jgi:hypothetical protein|nr:hypothetical protein [Bacteroidia bacterium]
MVLVFKTSVSSTQTAQQLKPRLNEMAGTGSWNFDLDDCDRILRIETDEDLSLSVSEMLSRHGIKCEPL